MGKLRTFIIIPIFIILSTQMACAHSQIWNAQGQESNFEALSDSLKTHSVIVLGENHGLKTHQNQHLQVLNALRSAGRKVHVGLEFFSFPYQKQVDAYRLGQLSEGDFLKQIEWGGLPFDFYKAQSQFPDYSLGERTWALNAPRSLTGAIAKWGIAGLSQELQQLLPPDFELGRESYRKRFFKAMGDHLPDPQAAQRYFEAQSTWDDTMAWKVENFKAQYPDAVLVVIVGEFHAQYGGGLPDRLRARDIQDVLVISQVNIKDLSDEEVKKEILPDPEYGPRADWIWTAPALD